MKNIQYLEIKKITSFLIISFFLVLAFGSSDDDEESVNTEVEISIPLPSEQANFSAIIDSMYNVYTVQPNELKKSPVKKARNSLFEEIKFNRKVTNWIGKLDRMSTSSSGNASINIKLIGSRAEVHTLGDIELNSDLFNDIASLSEGDTIVISGSFIREYSEYLYESSVTESGSMSNPEFYFKFKSIEKFVPSSGQIVPDSQ